MPWLPSPDLEFPSNPQSVDYEDIYAAFGVQRMADACLPDQILHRYREHYRATFAAVFLPQYQAIANFHVRVFPAIRHAHIPLQY
jgi:hypothetical protein